MKKASKIKLLAALIGAVIAAAPATAAAAPAPATTHVTVAGGENPEDDTPWG